MEHSGLFGVAMSPRVRAFVAGLVVLTLLFALPLYHWVQLALSVDLHSHVILIPLISAYLIWRSRDECPKPENSAWWVASLFWAASVGLAWIAWRCGDAVEPRDRVALLVGAYVLGGIGLAFACLGVKVMRALAFPAFLTIFMVPMPSGLEAVLERFLQRLSAEAAQGFFWLSGETFLREGQVFLFPGLTIRVAQECSGIRSSLVLLIVGLLAAHLMLRTTWRRAVLVLAILPLGVLRNGFRVYAITTLTLHVHPGVIDSPLHHHGGPLFFVLSLFPFAALLWLLWRTDRPPGKTRIRNHSS